MICSASRAAAIALSDSGVKVITHVPGYGGNEIIADYESATGRKITISFNEEPALTIAHGAAIAERARPRYKNPRPDQRRQQYFGFSIYRSYSRMVILAGDDPAEATLIIFLKWKNFSKESLFHSGRPEKILPRYSGML